MNNGNITVQNSYIVINITSKTIATICIMAYSLIMIDKVVELVKMIMRNTNNNKKRGKNNGF